MKRAKTGFAAPAFATERRSREYQRGAFAPMRGRLMPREAREVNRKPFFRLTVAREEARPLLLTKVDRLPAVVAPRIQAILQFALMVEVIEGPVAEGDEDDHGDEGEKIAAPA
jgi:hypothetical protein